MYKKAFARRIGNNKHLIHLWTDEGYEKVEWTNFAYKECSEADADYIGLNGEPLRKTSKWGPEDSGLHFHDMKAYQKFLVEKYGTNDEPSTTHRELFFDIETEMGDALTPEYIQSAPKKVTSIAWYDKQVDEWGILILDTKNQLEHTKARNKEITPCKTESDLLAKFLEKFREIDPDIIVGYNSDYFDIPYLYYRMCNVLGEDWAKHLSPIGYVRETPWYKDQYIQIAGVESLDYIRLHKKFSWKDEPSWKLDAIGEKYVGINKVEYEGNLDSLFESDINKFIQYNFVDVEILVELDKKLEYLALSKNLSHKGKHNYGEVYANTNTQDGAISAYLLSQNIIPPAKDKTTKSEKGYAGGYLFCPKAGIYNYMFDEDLTSLYPSIIMSLNIGKETLKGRIINADDRNNRLGLNDLKSKDPKDTMIIKNSKGKSAEVTISNLINFIESNKFTVSANGTMFATNRQSVLSTILAKWFGERVLYKGKMKKAYQAGDKEAGAKYHLLQYTMKILLNSLYGATALPSFRYGNVNLSKAITLSGQRIIQESALIANKKMNKEIKNVK
jgi:DNA polymerase elongation subunit (family B)|tara:strand:+ start:13174 stop:14850 length:1677 start_codon:yes stop_codon:yes gene_type:complete